MASNTSKTMIAALQVSLDGFIEGPHGERDWADSWASAIELIPDVDTFVLGGRMYPGYGEYWEAIYANPERVPPFQERVPSKSEIAYARLAANTPHIVLSKTLRSVSWPAAQIIPDVAELRTLKAQPGKNVYVVGGATLVASLCKLCVTRPWRVDVESDAAVRSCRSNFRTCGEGSSPHDRPAS